MKLLLSSALLFPNERSLLNGAWTLIDFCCQEKPWAPKCPIIRQVMIILRQERAKRNKMLQVEEL